MNENSNSVMSSFKRRRTILISPSFQFRYIGYGSIGSILSLLVFFGSIRYFFRLFAEKGVAMGMPPNHMFFVFLNEQKVAMNSVFIVAAIILISLNVVYGLFASHRMAGPIFRIQNYLQSRINGEAPGPLKLRRSDSFKELAELIEKSLKVT